MAARSRRLVVAATVVLAVAVGGYLGGRTLWNGATSPFRYDHCTVGAFEVDPAQAAVASTMVATVTRQGLPERAAVLVLAAGLQESKLRNLPAGSGDRDSVGVLQQRPSQGWGSQAQLNDVGYATRAFLQHLVQVANWQSLPLAEAVQAVQISADGSAYARHENEAQALADALQGITPAGITCSFDAPTAVASTATVARQVATDLPVNPPTTSGGAVSVPGASWQTAAWFVANADRLGIEKVAYSGREWSRTAGWKTADAAGSAAVVATMHPK